MPSREHGPGNEAGQWKSRGSCDPRPGSVFACWVAMDKSLHPVKRWVTIPSVQGPGGAGEQWARMG